MFVTARNLILRNAAKGSVSRRMTQGRPEQTSPVASSGAPFDTTASPPAQGEGLGGVFHVKQANVDEI
jgi:hypothetical protein